LATFAHENPKFVFARLPAGNLVPMVWGTGLRKTKQLRKRHEMHMHWGNFLLAGDCICPGARAGTGGGIAPAG
ncbi:MAG: hypothetical protein MUF06_07335, partial [Pirellulaceae bacterium]|nr:hypothetical protein [Pirellulaceae bacterium]